MVRDKPGGGIGALKTVGDAIRWAKKQLVHRETYFGHGTDSALDEAAWLVGGALRLPPAELAAHHGDAITSEARSRLKNLIDRRATERRPTAYLLNQAWFAGLPFYVDERVVVPRSLTSEFIQECFRPWIDPSRVRRVLDLCTGSGCMAIACARSFPSARVDAVDISSGALAVARINVDGYGLGERVRLLQSDLFSKLAGNRYDIIVTNPPYVSHAEMQTLPAEYRHEPVLGLESGTDGLDAISRILHDAGDHIEPQGILVAEVGNSNVALQEKFADIPFLWLSSEHDDDGVFLLTAEQLAEHRARQTRRRSE